MIKHMFDIGHITNQGWQCISWLGLSCKTYNPNAQQLEFYVSIYHPIRYHVVILPTYAEYVIARMRIIWRQRPNRYHRGLHDPFGSKCIVCHDSPVNLRFGIIRMSTLGKGNNHAYKGKGLYFQAVADLHHIPFLERRVYFGFRRGIWWLKGKHLVCKNSHVQKEPGECIGKREEEEKNKQCSYFGYPPFPFPLYTYIHSFAFSFSILPSPSPPPPILQLAQTSHDVFSMQA